jgi:hypothetical protein
MSVRTPGDDTTIFCHPFSDWCWSVTFLYAVPQARMVNGLVPVGQNFPVVGDDLPSTRALPLCPAAYAANASLIRLCPEIDRMISIEDCTTRVQSPEGSPLTCETTQIPFDQVTRPRPGYGSPTG